MFEVDACISVSHAGYPLSSTKFPTLEDMLIDLTRVLNYTLHQ
jgi:hypothetical protein